MGWQLEEYGSSHEGRAGAVLPDGSEPKPVYIDSGSGANAHSTSEWWAYDGTLGAPKADRVRGSCSCGWRGTSLYPLDWSQVDDADPDDFDLSGPHRDWRLHLADVESRSVPLPVGLADLLERLEQQLSALADDAPLAALKAVAALERTTHRVGRVAAYAAEADEIPWSVVGKALGLAEEDARSRITHYSIRR
ncbi:hypothetical protein GCM10010387_51070 [Streptomyces inusitatus]|uniref:Uncharacterized protein n=1 Tax=Streptomyces inusitatus TaxID=68221 RepID=A0A918QJS7_9ACTN|nr:hypothetical protein [Streptomyces inusitatus]GGZ50603.1 hypothetical protein GCM10010387_51070 [Streptomyces inusitatus]